MITERTGAQRVALAVAAAERTLVVYHGETAIKQLRLSGLHGEVLIFDRYVEGMQREARAEARRRHRPLVA